MIKFNVHDRFTGTVLFTAEIDCAKNASHSLKLGLAVKWAIKAGANLAGAYLAGANLADAYLADANLVNANLADANLAGANLADANLANAKLAGANLGGANLAGANLAHANLANAKCQFGVLRGLRPVIQIGPIGSESALLSAYHTDTGCHVRRGCFSGSLDDFAAAVDETHGDNACGREYRALIAFLRVWAAEQEASAAKQEAA